MTHKGWCLFSIKQTNKFIFVKWIYFRNSRFFFIIQGFSLAFALLHSPKPFPYAWDGTGQVFLFFFWHKLSSYLHVVKCKWKTVRILISGSTVKPVLSSHSKRRPKLVSKTNYGLMLVKSFAECSSWSILQYFQPLLSYHLSISSLLCLFLSGRLRQVLL